MSPGFEIVDSGNMTTKPFYLDGANAPKYYQYFTPTPLNSGESVTYTFTVRAIEEGTNYVAGIGYFEVDAFIHMYLNDENTMFNSEHRALYPELHPSLVERSQRDLEREAEAEVQRLLKEAIKNPRPPGPPIEWDELIEVLAG